MASRDNCLANVRKNFTSFLKAETLSCFKAFFMTRSLFGVFGGYFVGVIMLRLDSASFWSQMQNSVSLHDDVINGAIKSVVFGIAVTLIAIYQGFIAKPTASGVSSATTYTVVISAVTVLALDFILTALMF